MWYIIVVIYCCVLIMVILKLCYLWKYVLLSYEYNGLILFQPNPPWTSAVPRPHRLSKIPPPCPLRPLWPPSTAFLLTPTPLPLPLLLTLLSTSRWGQKCMAQRPPTASTVLVSSTVWVVVCLCPKKKNCLSSVSVSLFGDVIWLWDPCIVFAYAIFIWILVLQSSLCKMKIIYDLFLLCG